MKIIAYVEAEICHHSIVRKTYAIFFSNYLSKKGPRVLNLYQSLITKFYTSEGLMESHKSLVNDERI